MYGKTTDAEGKPLVKETEFTPILVGERVKGNELLSLDFAEDKDNPGQKITTRAELKFKQSNGAIFSTTFFDSAEEWSIANTNRTLTHVFSKVVSKEEYEKIVSGSSNFQEFITRIKEQIVPKAAGKLFTLKIVYITRKNAKTYASFPNFPSFIELDGTEPSTLSTNPKYDVYVKPVVANMETKSPTMSETTEENKNEKLPF